jgi:sarcosine oxidase/L-pipecolate oxidase
MTSEPSASTPRSILIIGSGVFGLSTALTLTQRPAYSQSTITVLDRSPFPAPDGSSIDTSRIIRPDYSDPAYTLLANRGQALWRGSLGGDGRYTESGLVLVADSRGEGEGEKYVKASYDNVKALMEEAGDIGAVIDLPTREDIERKVGTGGGSGAWGYLNQRVG